MNEKFEIGANLPQSLREVVEEHNRSIDTKHKEPNLTMRKMVYQIGLDEKTFSPKAILSIRNPNGTIAALEYTMEKDGDVLPKYTYKQQLLIDQVNMILDNNSHPQLIEEEIEYLLGIGKYDPKNIIPPEPEDLQALAGFKVIKKIIYTDKKR